MATTTRQGLIDYCLRALGEPVISVDIDDSQIEDRVDEALEYFKLYHYDGIEKMYMKHQIRASEMVLTTPTATTFSLEETIVGNTSGAKAKVTKEGLRSSSGALLLMYNVEGTFTPGETITGSAGHTAVVVSVTLGEYDKKYIDIDDWVYGITRVIPFAQASSSKNLFDLQYQLRLNDLYDLTSTSIVYFKTVMSHLAMLDLELNGYPMYRFNRLQDRLYLDINWQTDIPLGDFIVVEAYRALNPAEFAKVYNEPWLKRYVIALLKKQWAVNGKKFNGVQLPGGVTINFQAMYDEALEEIKLLEEEMINKSAPCELFLG